jgi:kumamolisin
VIGILEFGGGYLQSDLNAYSTLNGMPKIKVNNVSIDGTQNNPGHDLNADAEVTVDIQCAAASYYYATGTMPTIFVFFSNGDFINTFKAAVTAKCDVLSISWGNDERTFQRQAPGYAAQVEAAAQTATAAGLVIFAASGDFSSSDGGTGTNVDLPAACPHVIGCGGTCQNRVGRNGLGG